MIKVKFSVYCRLKNNMNVCCFFFNVKCMWKYESLMDNRLIIIFFLYFFSYLLLFSLEKFLMYLI